MRKFISVILALMLVLSTTVVAFSAYNVVDADAPTIEDALVADEYDGSLAKVYFMMPNGKNGPIADDDVYVHHPEVLDPDTGDVVEEAYDELVIEAGGKAPSWFNEFNIFYVFKCIQHFLLFPIVFHHSFYLFHHSSFFHCLKNLCEDIHFMCC